MSVMRQEKRGRSLDGSHPVAVAGFADANTFKPLISKDDLFVQLPSHIPAW